MPAIVICLALSGFSNSHVSEDVSLHKLLESSEMNLWLPAIKCTEAKKFRCINFISLPYPCLFKAPLNPLPEKKGSSGKVVFFKKYYCEILLDTPPVPELVALKCISVVSTLRDKNNPISTCIPGE